MRRVSEPNYAGRVLCYEIKVFDSKHISIQSLQAISLNLFGVNREHHNGKQKGAVNFSKVLLNVLDFSLQFCDNDAKGEKHVIR